VRRLPRAPVLASFALLALVGLTLIVFGGDDDDEPTAPPSSTSTTLATGGIDVDAPSGFRAIPLPSFDVGIAIPDDWEATRTDAETIASLEGRNLANPDFLPAARRAAAFGAVLYAAGIDDQGRVDDVQLRIYGRGRPTSAGELASYANELVTRASLRDAHVSSSTIDGAPAVTITFEAGTTDVPARGTELLRVDGDRIVSVVVTSEHLAGHAALVRAVTRTLVVA
jgi:hypothetical protein